MIYFNIIYLYYYNILYYNYKTWPRKRNGELYHAISVADSPGHVNRRKLFSFLRLSKSNFKDKNIPLKES